MWEAIAAAQFCTDGVADGWESDGSDHDTAEQKYLKVSCVLLCNQLAMDMINVCCKSQSLTMSLHPQYNKRAI